MSRTTLRAEALAELAGLLHGLGEYGPDFRARLRRSTSCADHSTAGGLASGWGRSGDGFSRTSWRGATAGSKTIFSVPKGVLKPGALCWLRPSVRPRMKVSCCLGAPPPRGFGDYVVTVNEADLPSGITVEKKI